MANPKGKVLHPEIERDIKRLFGVDQALRTLGEIRGKVYTEMIRLPAPDPLKDVLREVESMASKLEEEIRSL